MQFKRSINTFNVNLIFILLKTVESQQFLPGPCPYIPVIKDFDWHRYLGKWFEQERYPTFYQEVGTCWTGEYIPNPKGDVIPVRLTFRDILFKKKQEILIDVFAKRPFKAPNRLTYTIPNVPFFQDDYQVAVTDYKNWTIEYACKNHPLGRSQFAWILTRSPHPSKKVIWKAKAAMRKLGIETQFLTRNEKC